MEKLTKFGLYCLVYLVLSILLLIIIVMVSLIFLIPNPVAVYLLRVCVYIATYFIFKVGNRIKIIGRENVPKETGVLFLVNHQTLIDSLLLAIGTINFWDILFHPKRIAHNFPEAKNFYYNGFLRIFFKALKTVPISRSGVSRAKIENQVNQFCNLLEDSNLVVFFEGTRTRDGRINKCRIGPALTVIKARPRYIIPILLEGIQPIMPIEYGSKINLRINVGHRGRMIIGRPLNLEEFYQAEYNWETATAQSGRLRQIIKEAVENLKPSD